MQPLSKAGIKMEEPQSSIVDIRPDIELAAMYLLLAAGGALRWDNTFVVRLHQILHPVWTIEYEAFAALFSVFWFLVFSLSAFSTIAFKRPGEYFPATAFPIVIYAALVGGVTFQNSAGSMVGPLFIGFFLYVMIKNFYLQRERRALLAALTQYVNQKGPLEAPQVVSVTHAESSQ